VDSSTAATKTPRLFSSVIYGAFFWVLLGICFIYGVRLWFNAPLHPSFLPFIGAAFSAVLAFAIVLALEYAAGTIKLKFGSVNFEGASGPIILWCLAFFVTSFGLYMLGVTDVLKSGYKEDPRSILELFFAK
jgi:hypothetical protein